MAKKERMSEKMYKNSPTLETDESGKKYIKKNSPTEGEKKSARVSDGTEGIPINELHQKHEKEMFDLYQNHTKQLRDVYEKQRAEIGAGGGNPAGATGGEMINKVENDKKE